MSREPLIAVESALVTAVAAELVLLARERATITYAELTEQLAVKPPYPIRKVIVCLETLMRADAEAARPLLAAIVVSKVRDGLPAPGFFALARRLGLYQGAEEGPEARAWHAIELERAFAAWGE
jgi:hypothetical protein